MNLIHIREQLPPEVVGDHVDLDHSKQHLVGGVSSNNEFNITVDIVEENPPTISSGSIPHPHVLKCPHGDLLTFWRNPTQHDLSYVSPFKNYGPAQKYVTFEPDFGGWNNIRMQVTL